MLYLPHHKPKVYCFSLTDEKAKMKLLLRKQFVETHEMNSLHVFNMTSLIQFFCKDILVKPPLLLSKDSHG